LRTTTSVSAILVVLFLFLTLVLPFGWDRYKMKAFHHNKVNGRVFNAYFSPVGAYAGGFGNFWITETPKCFPIIEIERYYDRAVDWDFRAEEDFDGKPVNQEEVVKSYIQDEVLAREIK
jgi:hypothetical protein